MKKNDAESFWRLLGLAVRARKVISGSDAVERAIRQKKGFLLILACDMAQSGREKLTNIADKNGIEVIIKGDRYQLGKWTGKDERVTALVVDKGFADRLKDLDNKCTDTDNIIEANI